MPFTLVTSPEHAATLLFPASQGYERSSLQAINRDTLLSAQFHNNKSEGLQAHLGGFTKDFVSNARFIVRVVVSVEALFLGGLMTVIIGGCEASLSGRVDVADEGLVGRLIVSADASMSSRGAVTD